MNMLQQYEKEVIESLGTKDSVPEFRPGDTLVVSVKIKEQGSSTERTQDFEGVCIGIKRKGLGSHFVVRKISHGIGVERVFPTYSNRISIKVIRRGKVRRAKLYYLRKLSGKAAKIKERK